MKIGGGFKNRLDAHRPSSIKTKEKEASSLPLTSPSEASALPPPAATKTSRNPSFVLQEPALTREVKSPKHAPPPPLAVETLLKQVENLGDVKKVKDIVENLIKEKNFDVSSTFLKNYL